MLRVMHALSLTFADIQKAMKSMAEADAAPTPEIEAGSSQVSVNADGVIEVLMP